MTKSFHFPKLNEHFIEKVVFLTFPPGYDQKKGSKKSKTMMYYLSKMAKIDVFERVLAQLGKIQKYQFSDFQILTRIRDPVLISFEQPPRLYESIVEK